MLNKINLNLQNKSVHPLHCFNMIYIRFFLNVLTIHIPNFYTPKINMKYNNDYWTCSEFLFQIKCNNIVTYIDLSIKIDFIYYLISHDCHFYYISITIINSI